MVRRLQRQLPFLRSVLGEADQQVRRERLQHANADQVNAISELVFFFLLFFFIFFLFLFFIIIIFFYLFFALQTYIKCLQY